MKTTLDHLALTVRNLSESLDFYGRLFRFTLVESGLNDAGPWAIVRNADSMLCLYEDPSRSAAATELCPERHGLYHFGLRISDRDTWERTVRENRVSVEYGGPVQYPHSTSWYIRDPSGHRIEVAYWNDDRVYFSPASAQG